MELRVATFRYGSQLSWGVIQDDEISDAFALDGAPHSIVELLNSRETTHWLQRAAASVPHRAWHRLSAVRLLAPIPRPPHDPVALGLNYLQHVDEAAKTTSQASSPKQPILFSKAASSIIGPDDDITFERRLTTEVDWEVEVALVIARAGRNIRADQALDYVFGYTIANDVSARNLQFLEGGQWYRGKSADTFCPLGPWIVTADELGAARGLRLRLLVNGNVKQDSTTDALIFDVPAIIESVSDGRTLQPGGLILTGTPGGVGFSRQPPEFLQDGDLVEAEVERIGVLRNRVRELA